VKTSVLTILSVVSLGAAASAQERSSLDSESVRLSEERAWSYSWEESAAGPDVPRETIDPALPLSLSDSPASRAPELLPFSLGLSAGYLRAHNSDTGTWFAGVQARMRFGIFAAEASIQYHQDQYQNGGVVVTQYPVQLTAFLYPIPEGPFRPYLLGGVGWYYTNVEYRGSFSGLPERTDNIFGEHLGGGAEIFLGPAVSLDADLRYIFLNPTTDQVIGRAFNYWQLTFGLNLFF
jgi:opacity protein-like surface antigen